ncbi:uncharacterized protein PAC_09412 [Phialocephala subalpina]|uniref:Uncharacterized protein n=1 Tax=Phialocephala subalpina TaxID=576137 RepID=A0A1L7X3B7_9HELO|nr:uncharacterized protein PAC_09412 [Phialocephala subalpina]
MSLRELASGAGADGQRVPAIDIVAVHGLNPFNNERHAFNTWQKPHHDTGHLWLQDAFPKVQPNARIYLYEYNSSPVFGASKDTFVREANQLLDEIYGARWQIGRDNPIIFIGHSLGGLLIKQALVNAWANEKYRGIQSSTRGLMFFGTPHAGPGSNPEVRLGMVCAKVARSLPGIQSTKLLETLERGSLFSDFLREAFRHQLEAYQIVSCYEGVGDIVPFDSAVMNLPGDRETQLRINADHRNMCRFDLSVPADLDNYRKVERNLQMLCVDALIRVSKEDEEQEESLQLHQGGIDLGNSLLESVQISQNNISMPVTINIGKVPDLAWTVYRSCIQSPSSPEFARVAADVSYLHSALRMTHEMVEGDTFSKDYRSQIREISGSCFEALQDLQCAIDDFKALPSHSQNSWSRMGFESRKFANIEERLKSTTSMVTELNQALSSGSMNQLVMELNHLVEEIEAGEIARSVVSSHVSSLSESILMRDEDSWVQLRKELENSGLSLSILAEQREFICKWLMNAIESGRLPPENQSFEFDTTTHESAESTSAAQAISTTEATNRITTKIDDMNLSLMRRFRFAVFGGRRSLLAAVQERDLARAMELLTLKIPIDAEDKSGKSALDIAVLNGDIEMIKLLLDNGMTRKDWRRMKYIQQATKLAASKHNWGAIEALLARGAQYQLSIEQISAALRETTVQVVRKLMESNEDGRNNQLLLDAAYYGDLEAFQFLLNSGADIHVKLPPSLFYVRYHATGGLSALHLAAANCNTVLMRFILENGCDIEDRDDLGETPIHKVPCAEDGLGIHSWDRNGSRIVKRILSQGPDTAMQLLLDKGADLNSRNKSGQTTLHLSAIYNEDLVIDVLLRNGMDIGSTDNMGNTALHAAIIRDHSPSRVSSVSRHGPGGSSESNAKNLPTAGDWNEKAILLLVRSKANVNAKNFDGKTPLHLASITGNGSVTQVLIENGAKVDAIDNRRWTALHHAVWNKSMPVVLVLLGHGASTTLKALDEHGRKEITVLQMARDRDFDAITQVLESIST